VGGASAHPGAGAGRWPLAVSQWTLGETDPVTALGRIAGAGFDTVELSGPGPTGADAGRFDAGRALAQAGLRASSVCPLYGPERDLASPDPAVRRAGTDLLRASVDLAGSVGAEVVIVVPSDRPAPLTPEPRGELLRRVAQEIFAVAEMTAPGGPTLVIEPLNRYETHLVRTVGDAAALCSMIGSDRVAVMADVFHAGMEEDSLAAALHRHADLIRHIHLADNQRREPGSGQLDLAGVITLLAEIGFEGVVALEFLPADDPALRQAREHLLPLLAGPSAVPS
jgi:D-psicose/D-tagatose/L-ribulose 3-epimerase